MDGDARTVTIGATSQLQRAAIAASPARVPVLGGVLPTQGTDPASSDSQATSDPLRPTGSNGWSPDRIVAVRSRNDGGFVGSALTFALGGVEELPGQRLSVAQVDALAPFYALEFGLDEAYVRRELAKVYLYVGGPSTTAGQAMTIGHHVFLPDSRSLERILSTGGRRWLAHELAHTMQLLAYDGGSPHRFLADYFTSMVVARDPREPGTGQGPAVWGALFTGLRTMGRPEDAIGTGATTLRDRAASTVLPAAAVSLPVAVAAGGGLAAARATTGINLLGTGASMRTGFGVVAAPALTGSVIGSLEDRLGTGWTQTLGAVSGGAIAGATLWAGGAWHLGGSGGLTQAGPTLGRTGALGLATAAVVGGAAIGFMSASASANTARGWSSSAQVLHSLRDRPVGEAPRELTYTDALHDAHWGEIDAEAIARTFVRGDWKRQLPTGGPVSGRTPTAPASLAAKIDADVSTRIDWGVKLPLLLGVPTAVGLGAGVLASRTGVTALRSTLRDGRSVRDVIGEAMRQLGSQSRGVGNSLGVGASLTAAPLMAGGLVGPVVFNATGSETAARVGGGAAGAVTAGALLTLLLRGKGSSLIAMSGKVGAGMALAGALGLVAGGVATDALRPHVREYDVSRGVRATT